MLLLCLFAGRGFSQEVSFYLHIMDKDRIVSHSGGVPVFDDPDINDIFAGYAVTHFAKAFPLSGYEYLQRVYQVTADSIGLAQELVAFDNVLFPMYEELGEVEPLAAFYPDDWIGDWPNDTTALAFINAPQAWDISKGDPNIIIGVTDSYFDVDHEDMQGQYAKMATNNNPISNHGTLVASLIAAKTNNGIGIPGIGFNCRLYGGDYHRVGLHSIAMDKSVNKVRVLNASWRILGLHRDVLYFNDQVSFNEQGSYNEIYEQGVVMVAAAGNGTNQSSPHPAERYIFPASFDHNISVSGVGHFAENTTDSAFNAKYVHDLYAGDSLVSH